MNNKKIELFLKMRRALSPPVNFYMMSALAVLIFYALRYCSPIVLTWLYDHQAFSVLNQLTGSVDGQGLDFYLGMVEDQITGPLAMMAAAGILIVLLLRHGRQISLRRFFMVMLFFLIATRPEVLFYPPYGEHLGCSLTEAVWLLRNDFNYVGLFQAPSYLYGGPKHYLFTIYPGFIAFLMKVSPDPKIFLFITHLMFFAMSAAIVALLREIARKVFSEDLALLTAILLLFLPLFQSLTEIINMEVPVLFFIMLTAYALVQKRMFDAAICAMLSLMVKGSGIIAAGAFVITTGLLVFADFPPDRWQKRFKNILMISTASGLILFSILLVKLRSWFVEAYEGSFNTVKIFVGIGKFSNISMLVFILLLTALVFIGLFARSRRGDAERFIPAAKKFIAEHYGALVLYIMMLMWFVLQINFSNLSARYIFSLLPFAVFCSVFSLRKVVASPVVARFFVTVAILAAALCSYGFPEPPRVREFAVYNELEKSLAYRNDLRLHIKMIKELEKNVPHFTIGAPYPVGHMLAFPEFGFVRQPFNVITFLVDTKMGTMKNFRGLKHLDQMKTVWIIFEDDLPGAVEAVQPGDKILGKMEVGNKRVFFVQGGYGVQKAYESKFKAAVRKNENFSR